MIAVAEAIPFAELTTGSHARLYALKGEIVARGIRSLKVFLTAGAAQRAERRYKQLISKGIPANIDGLRADLVARDARDVNRSVSPLKPAEGAFLLDNSALTIEASVAAVLEAWEERRPFDRPQV